MTSLLLDLRAGGPARAGEPITLGPPDPRALGGRVERAPLELVVGPSAPRPGLLARLLGV